MQKTKEEDRESLLQLQLTEQGLQNLMLQKQMFQAEIIETDHALKELGKIGKGDVYKVVSSLMFKSDKVEVKKELEKKKDILNLRVRAIEKQEEDLKNKVNMLREKVMKSLK